MLGWPRRFAGWSSSHMWALRGLIPLLVVWLLLLLLSCDPPVASAAPLSDPHILEFAPQGTVKGVRQVSARFSEPMVPLGDPRVSAELFEIDCPEPGTGHWVDSRTWVYDFARDLPGGIRCTFRLRPGLTSLSGKVVAGQQAFAFSTARLRRSPSWPTSLFPLQASPSGSACTCLPARCATRS